MDERRAEANGGFGFLRQLFGERAGEAAAAEAASTASTDPVGEAAFLALKRQGIRATPEAYTLWYKHLAGERPELTQRLKELEARREVFDAALIGELYERYFGSEREVLQVYETSHNTERLLAALRLDLDRVEADTAARGDRLGQLGAELAARNAAAAAPAVERERCAGLRELVAAIVKETAEMRLAASRLQRRVVESAAEIAQLRAALAAAGAAEELDPVSGAGNRKALERALRRAIVQAETAGEPVAFLIVDLDRFAAFNDAHGRRMGDLMLKAVAGALTLALKRQDTVGRLDGANFGIVLARTDLPGAVALAEKLCQAIATISLDTGEAGPPIAGVSAAIGVAVHHQGEPLKRLVGRADRARQLAKEAGGGRAVSERAIAVVGRPKA